MWWFALVRKGAYDRAFEDVNAGLEQDPNLTLCQFARGDVYFHRGDYQKMDIEALSRRAEAYEKLGEQEKALADFKSALKNAPANKGALQGVARLTAEEQ